jgi:hypothetical protein
MPNLSQPIFDMSKAQPVDAPMFDMSKAQALSTVPAPPADQGTIGPGPGPLGRAWNDIKSGLTAAQPGGGLVRQPSVLGNVSEAMGGLATGVSQLGLPTEGMAPSVAEGMAGAMPSFPKTTLQQASELFNQAESKIADAPVNMTNELRDAMDHVKDNFGGPMSRALTRIMDASARGQGPGDSIPPLTWEQGRSAYSNLNDEISSASRAGKDNLARLLIKAKGALGDALENTADAKNALPEYQGAMKGWAQGSSRQELLDKLKDFVTPKLDFATSLKAGGLYGLYHELKGYFE